MLDNHALHGDSATLDEGLKAGDLYREAIYNHIDGDVRAMEIISDFCMKKAKMIVKNYSNIDYQDIAQEALLQVYKSLRSYDARKSAGHVWLGQIVTNKYRDALRRDKVRPKISLDAKLRSRTNEKTEMSQMDSLFSDEIEGLDKLMETEEIEGVEEKINAEIEEEKPINRIARMKLFHGTKYEDISRSLKIPVGTIKSTLHRKMKKIKKLFPSERLCHQ
ncbi:MAG: RNA polymerase sigma factor [Nanoarchaeota archaeon]